LFIKKFSFPPKVPLQLFPNPKLTKNESQHLNMGRIDPSLGEKPWKLL
jgi:hypothetical protein